MSTKRLLMWVVLVVAQAAIAASDVLCQSSPPASARQLGSADWRERTKAFETISKESGAWTGPQMRAALLSLYRLEDDVTISSLRESGGKVPAGDRFGEGYAEYTAEVFDTCFRYCDRSAVMNLLHRDAAVGSPIRSTTLDVLNVLYDRGELSADEQTAALGDFLNAVGDSTSSTIRQSALGALGIAMRNPSGLPEEGKSAVHRALVAATADRSTRVRVSAVLLIGELGNPADSALLKRLADEDTSRALSHGQWNFPVREAAKKALEAMGIHPKY